MRAVIYLGRNNAFSLTLVQNNKVVPENRIVRAQLWFPGFLTISGEALTLDTNDASDALTLAPGAQKLIVRAGHESLKPGEDRAMLTLFDVNNSVKGLAWDAVDVSIRQWLPTV